MKPPWRPSVSGIAGFLCGPLAAALIAFINLRRLNQHGRAAWTLVLTSLGCVVLGVAIANLSDDVFAGLGKVIGNIVSPFLYPLLQKRAFEEWEANHPGATPDHGWRSSGWAILGLATFFVVTIGSGLVASWNAEARDIEVRYVTPEKVKVGENFLFTITVQNTADHPQLLHSLDIDTHFLEGISIERTTPAYERSEPNPLAPIKSYIFNQNISPKGAVQIEIQGHARKIGSFPLGLDVCVQTAFNCSTFELGSIAVE